MQVTGLTSQVTAISAGNAHTCAIHNGSAKCWGWNNAGRLGDGSIDNRDIPVQVTGLTSQVTAISAGFEHTCAIHNGAAKCWGHNGNGRLGDGAVTTFDTGGAMVDNHNRMTPVQVTGLESDVTAISAGDTHTCALHSGVAKCWGNNANGRLGVGKLADGDDDDDLPDTFSPAPQTLSIPSFVPPRAPLAISAGTAHTCAIVKGKAWCWGSNGNGRLGNPDNNLSKFPVAVVQTAADTTTDPSNPIDAVLLDSGVARISTGDKHTCAIVDGTAKCWGNNEDGRLGNDSLDDSNAPVDVTGMTSNVFAISAGSFHTCAVHNGAAKCWGNNVNGQLGDNTVTTVNSLGIIETNNNNRMVPVQVMGLVSDVTVISAGGYHTCAIHNGAAKCWGNNEEGRLGDNTRTIIASGGAIPSNNNRMVPVQVMGLVSDVTAISAGTNHTCAIHSGAAKCWGKNNFGQLGNNSDTDSSVPVAVVQTAADTSDSANPIAEGQAGQRSHCHLSRGYSHLCHSQWRRQVLGEQPK